MKGDFPRRARYTRTVTIFTRELWTHSHKLMCTRIRSIRTLCAHVFTCTRANVCSYTHEDTSRTHVRTREPVHPTVANEKRMTKDSVTAESMNHSLFKSVHMNIIIKQQIIFSAFFFSLHIYECPFPYE